MPREHPARVADVALAFHAWSSSWMALARFDGPRLLDAEARCAKILSLWQEPIPAGWWRGADARVLDPHRRYCRGNGGPAHVRRGEHAIEYDILAPQPAETPTACLGAPLIDGVNAVPLTTDPCGGRSGNVEADMLLLTGKPSRQRLVLVEVKDYSDNAWYAAVENLRQLRLLRESVVTQRIFHRRRPDLELQHPLPVTALVVAPRPFYSAPGKRSASVRPAQELLHRVRDATGADARLATWDAQRRAIEALENS